MSQQPLESRRTGRRPIRLLLSAGAGALALTVGLLFLDSVRDPWVDYNGDIMRRSEMALRSDGVYACQQRTWLPFGAQYACFDSQREMEATSGRWSMRWQVYPH